jgi:hypothetical protein
MNFKFYKCLAISGAIFSSAIFIVISGCVGSTIKLNNAELNEVGAFTVPQGEVAPPKSGLRLVASEVSEVQLGTVFVVTADGGIQRLTTIDVNAHQTDQVTSSSMFEVNNAEVAQRVFFGVEGRGPNQSGKYPDFGKSLVDDGTKSSFLLSDVKYEWATPNDLKTSVEKSAQIWKGQLELGSKVYVVSEAVSARKVEANFDPKVLQILDSKSILKEIAQKGAIASMDTTGSNTVIIGYKEPVRIYYGAVLLDSLSKTEYGTAKEQK